MNTCAATWSPCDHDLAVKHEAPAPLEAASHPISTRLQAPAIARGRCPPRFLQSTSKSRSTDPPIRTSSRLLRAASHPALLPFRPCEAAFHLEHNDPHCEMQLFACPQPQCHCQVRSGRGPPHEIGQKCINSAGSLTAAIQHHSGLVLDCISLAVQPDLFSASIFHRTTPHPCRCSHSLNTMGSLLGKFEKSRYS